MFVSDVYSLKVFGRTKIAKEVMYAKQVGEQSLIANVTREIRPKLLKLIDTHQIDAIAFVPPTVPRPVQFVNEVRRLLAIDLTEIEMVKILGGEIPVPQKTLSSLDERLQNANSTLFVKESKTISAKNILIIDDVVGSGAFFQVVASKISHLASGKYNIFAFAIVGNSKGFETVREL